MAFSLEVGAAGSGHPVELDPAVVVGAGDPLAVGRDRDRRGDALDLGPARRGERVLPRLGDGDALVVDARRHEDAGP